MIWLLAFASICIIAYGVYAWREFVKWNEEKRR
jgi:hypothetical protein